MIYMQMQIATNYSLNCLAFALHIFSDSRKIWSWFSWNGTLIEFKCNGHCTTILRQKLFTFFQLAACVRILHSRLLSKLDSRVDRSILTLLSSTQEHLLTAPKWMKSQVVLNAWHRFCENLTFNKYLRQFCRRALERKSASCTEN